MEIKGILCTCACSFSCAPLFVTPGTVAHQAPLSMGFYQQEYWSVLPFPPPGIFSTQGSNLHLLHCREVSLPLSNLGSPQWQLDRCKICLHGCKKLELVTVSHCFNVYDSENKNCPRSWFWTLNCIKRLFTHMENQKVTGIRYGKD